jgi:hypothetical protein
LQQELQTQLVQVREELATVRGERASHMPRCREQQSVERREPTFDDANTFVRRITRS